MALACFSEIREEKTKESLQALGAACVHAAQSILGLEGWAISNKSLEGTFAYSVLAGRATHYLTESVWQGIILRDFRRYLSVE